MSAALLQRSRVRQRQWLLRFEISSNKWRKRMIIEDLRWVAAGWGRVGRKGRKEGERLILMLRWGGGRDSEEERGEPQRFKFLSQDIGDTATQSSPVNQF